jgi:hypothetical protein
LYFHAILPNARVFRPVSGYTARMLGLRQKVETRWCAVVDAAAIAP